MFGKKAKRIKELERQLYVASHKNYVGMTKAELLQLKGEVCISDFELERVNGIEIEEIVRKKLAVEICRQIEQHLVIDESISVEMSGKVYGTTLLVGGLRSLC